ncbi:MAG TPA: LpqB family beta-propeller domain-containing protein [Candidatus Lumbricidophila sp.]|nr:LpqB family beta-propeller domain-containing protein [Candidatus Lumbricidophila sp.]
MVREHRARTRRRPWRAVVSLVTAFALSGCAGIPDSGPVNPGHPAAGEESLDFDQVAEGPRTGDSPEQVLRGFLDAASSPQNNYQIAKSFLTQEFAAQWRPDAGVTIDTFSHRQLSRVADGSFVLTTTPTAAVTGFGQYEPTADTPVSLQYALVRAGGEWRISAAPSGLVIDAEDFARAFTPHTLRFFDPTYNYSVPDVRWFAGRDSAQTSIVRALLAGPADWLAPGVATAFPAGARLEPDAVPIQDEAAEVAIDTASTADPLTVSRMRFQLRESLASVRSIQSVRFAVNGVVRSETPVEPASNPRVDSRQAAYDGVALGFLPTDAPGKLGPIAALKLNPELQPAAAAVSADVATAAVLQADGVVRITPSGSRPVDARPGLIAPSLDRYGVIWTVPRNAPGKVRATTTAGTSIDLAAPWAGSAITSLEVSRDGTRVLALLADGNRSVLNVAAITRRDDGAPIALGTASQVVAQSTAGPVGAVWLDGVTIATLTTTADGPRISICTVGGEVQTQAAPPDAVALSGGNGVRELRVLTRTGAVVTRSGLTWQGGATGIRFLVTQAPA